MYTHKNDDQHCVKGGLANSIAEPKLPSIYHPSTDALTFTCAHTHAHTDEGLGNISSQFAIGFGSFVDKIAYPFASTLQNGSDYMTFHLTRNRYYYTVIMRFNNELR